MPPSSIVSGSIFAAGLALGVGGAALAFRPPQSSSTLPPPFQASSSTPVPLKSDDSYRFTSGPLADVKNVSGQTGGASQVVLSEGMKSMGSEVMRYGFPGPTPDILKRTAYVAAYDRRLRHPAWTAEHMTAASLKKPPTLPGQIETKGDRSKSQFVEDSQVPEMFRAGLKDYFRSGYDRGHMVPAADAKISQLAMDETFLLTNIAPQVGDGFNRHYWAYLEEFCRRLTGNFEDVWVFTVPLYLPAQGPDGKWRVSYEVIGTPSPTISVPTHFAKVILTSRPSGVSPTSPLVGNASSPTAMVGMGPNKGDGVLRELSIGAFVLPNAVIPDETNLRTFVVPVEAVERAAGLTLFSPAIKSSAKELCRETKCELIIRRFDDARKAQGQGQVQGKRS